MSIISDVRNEDIKAASLGSHNVKPYREFPAKISFNMQIPVITNPINPTRISKMSTSGLTKSSVVKAGLVFLGTVGTYYLAKTTNILSYFGWAAKNSNLKDTSSSEIMEIKNRANTLTVRKNLETARQVNNPSVNRIAQKYKDGGRTVKFEEIEVKEFKEFPEIKKENVENRRSSSRRSINIQNPIPDQNATVGKLFELTVDGNHVFSSSSSLFFLDSANTPAWLTSYYNPTFKGSYDMPSGAYGIAISGNYAYVVDFYSGLYVIDVTDPSNPTFKGSYDTPSNAVDVALSGNYAYVVDYLDLQIIDISDPSNPTFKGSYDTPNSANGNGVAISGNYAYVVDGLSGLRIIDISDPSNPTFKGRCRMPDISEAVAVSGNYAYVADDRSGLQIIDISDPSNPTFESSYNTPGRAFGVALSENYAYVADLDSGLQIIDISDPANPTFKGSYDIPSSAHYIALSENYAYVIDYSGLQIIDISDPSNPIFKGLYNTPDRVFGVAVSENYAYVAAKSGLQIITLNLDKLTLSGTPSSLGMYSVDIEACNKSEECVTDNFDIIVGNNAPVIANPIQNQTAIINTLFNYVLPTNTFIDPDEHSLTYTAKSSNNEPLPSWLNFDSIQRKFSGIPNTLTTYPVKVTANDNYGGSVSTMFNLIVTDTYLTLTSMIIISSMTVVVCIAAFCLSLIIGGGIVAVRRNRNKILRNEGDIKAEKQKEEEELQKMETGDNKEIVVEKEFPQLNEVRKDEGLVYYPN